MLETPGCLKMIIANRLKASWDTIHVCECFWWRYKDVFPGLHKCWAKGESLAHAWPRQMVPLSFTFSRSHWSWTCKQKRTNYSSSFAVLYKAPDPQLLWTTTATTTTKKRKQMPKNKQQKQKDKKKQKQNHKNKCLTHKSLLQSCRGMHLGANFQGFRQSSAVDPRHHQLAANSTLGGKRVASDLRDSANGEG